MEIGCSKQGGDVLMLGDVIMLGASAIKQARLAAASKGEVGNGGGGQGRGGLAVAL